MEKEGVGTRQKGYNKQKDQAHSQPSRVPGGFSTLCSSLNKSS